MLQTNVAGTFNVIRQAAELINENEGNADQQRGVIINTSSIAAFDGQIGIQNFFLSFTNCLRGLGGYGR